MKKFAILLGCDEYKDFNNYPGISFCHDDVTLLEKTLIEYCGYAQQDIYCDLLSIYHETTPDNILKEIEKLLKKSEEGDTILFYYAGHGDNVKDESYLVLPYTQRDNISQTGLPLRDISDLLRKNDRINVRIFDCCHSGQDVRSAIDKIGSIPFIQDISNNNNGWVTLASCGENECSYPDNKFGHGVFTYYLVESIKEFNEKEEIYPEILKLKVVEKVSKWCIENGRNQTPIFNASISGNISLGIRMKKIETHSLTALKDINIDSKLLNRINTMRSRKKSSDEESKELLKKYIVKIHESLIENKENINNYNLSLIDNSPMISENIPYNIKAAIVMFFNSKEYSTFHKYKMEKIYDRDTRPNYLKSAFNGFVPKLISTKYTIEQEYGFPESYTDMNLKADGYLPEANFFVHVAPLQLTVCIVSGMTVDGVVQLFRPSVLKINEDINNEFINNFITELIGKFNIEYQKSVERIIKYYESEVKLTVDK